MSDANVAKLHGQLGELDKESGRQRRNAKRIRVATEKMLEATDKRLAEIHGMTDGAEYQRLTEERGVLMQLLEQDAKP